VDFLTIKDGKIVPRKKIKTPMIGYIDMPINGEDKDICENFNEWSRDKSQEISNSWRLSGETMGEVTGE